MVMPNNIKESEGETMNKMIKVIAVMFVCALMGGNILAAGNKAAVRHDRQHQVQQQKAKQQKVVHKAVNNRRVQQHHKAKQVIHHNVVNHNIVHRDVVEVHHIDDHDDEVGYWALFAAILGLAIN